MYVYSVYSNPVIIATGYNFDAVPFGIDIIYTRQYFSAPFGNFKLNSDANWSII